MAEVQYVEFDGPCPYLLCVAPFKHKHYVCPKCGAARYGNLSCDECRRNVHMEWELSIGYARNMKTKYPDDAGLDSLITALEGLIAKHSEEENMPAQELLREPPCPNCGAEGKGENGEHETAVRQVKGGIVDVGWRCWKCKSEWGFELSEKEA